MKTRPAESVFKLWNEAGVLLICVFCFIISGCVSVFEQREDSSDGFIVCKDPRPEICTQEYDPVCGYWADGSPKTYGNACSACSDKKVVKYKVKPCPEESVK